VWVLVDRYKLAKILAHKARDEVLADKARGPGNDNFSC
jgi:hypothetical protein